MRVEVNHIDKEYVEIIIRGLDTYTIIESVTSEEQAYQLMEEFATAADDLARQFNLEAILND